MYQIKRGVYRHCKGNEYEVVGFAKHSETLEDMVVYKALYGERGTWVRPLSMWNELVEAGGKKVKRFEYVRDASDRSAAFEEIYREVTESLAAIPPELEKLKAEGKEKTVRYRELLGQKLLNSHIIDMFKRYGI